MRGGVRHASQAHSCLCRALTQPCHPTTAHPSLGSRPLRPGCAGPMPHLTPCLHAASPQPSLPSVSTQEPLFLPSAPPGSPLGFFVLGTFTDLSFTTLCLVMYPIFYRWETEAHRGKVPTVMMRELNLGLPTQAHSPHCTPKAEQAGREPGGSRLLLLAKALFWVPWGWSYCTNRRGAIEHSG